MIIDRIAVSSPLASLHPGEKALFAGLSLAVCLWAAGPVVPLVVMALMAFIIVVKGRVGVGLLTRLMAVPLGFALVSLAAMALRVDNRPFDSLAGLALGSWHVGITSEGLTACALLLLKSQAAAASVYFFVLTTTVADIDYLFDRARMPAFLRELVILTYRYIDLSADTAARMYASQRARGGYRGPVRSLRSLSALVASLFVVSLGRARMAGLALQARGFDGALRYPARQYRHSRLRVAGIVLVQAAFIIGVARWGR